MAEQSPHAEMLHEAVGVFADQAMLDRTMRELLGAGFDRANLSLLGPNGTVRHAQAWGYPDTHLAEDDPGAPRAVWIEPESRAEGRSALAGVLAYLGAVGGLAISVGSASSVTLAATAAGAGVLGSLGFGLGRLLDGRLADGLRANLDHGGIVVWVKVMDDTQASQAGDLLRKNGAQDVHIHHI